MRVWYVYRVELSLWEYDSLQNRVKSMRVWCSSKSSRADTRLWVEFDNFTVRVKQIRVWLSSEPGWSDESTIHFRVESSRWEYSSLLSRVEPLRVWYSSVTSWLMSIYCQAEPSRADWSRCTFESKWELLFYRIEPMRAWCSSEPSRWEHDTMLVNHNCITYMRYGALITSFCRSLVCIITLVNNWTCLSVHILHFLSSVLCGIPHSALSVFCIPCLRWTVRLSTHIQVNSAFHIPLSA